MIVSATLGESFSNSFWSMATRTSGIWYLLNLGVYIYTLWILLVDRAKQDRLILTILISTAIYSLLSFLSPEGIGWLFKGYESDGFTFGNSSFAGMYILGAFLLSAYYLLKSESKKWWMYVLPIVIVINPNIINSSIFLGDFSNGVIGEARASSYLTLASIFSVISLYYISKIKVIGVKKKIVYTLSILGIVLLGLFSISLLSPDGYFRNLYLSKATGARPLVWEVSEKVISENPYLGWGSDNFERVFELKYDNRLLQDSYGAEAWFDRAHNVLIDQLVDNGFVGLILYIAVYLAIIFSMLKVYLGTKNNEDRILSSILITYFAVHFVELQTAFDTTVSYIMLALMFSLSVSLYSRFKSEEFNKSDVIELGGVYKYISLCIASVAVISSVIFGLIPLIRSEYSNGVVRTVGTSEGRMEAYKTLVSSPVDLHSFLWRMTTDLKKGIGSNPSILNDKQRFTMLGKEIQQLTEYYRQYVVKNPNHFRAKLNLADMLIYQRLFGIDRLSEAQSVLDDAIKLVPQAPQSYWMKSVAYLYTKRFDQAREYADMALKLNPNIDISKDLVKYIDKSIKDFPVIDLYNFRQI
jgi:O-antigen ligase